MLYIVDFNVYLLIHNNDLIDDNRAITKLDKDKYRIYIHSVSIGSKTIQLTVYLSCSMVQTDNGDMETMLLKFNLFYTVFVTRTSGALF